MNAIFVIIWEVVAGAKVSKQIFVTAFLLLVSLSLFAQATPDIEIWLGERVGRFGDYEFAVVGGSPEYPTPKGAFVVQWKARSWWSRQWDAPMPYAIFFHRGAAIHVGSLGSHSHGCVRVSEQTARYLFANVREGVTRVFVYP